MLALSRHLQNVVFVEERLVKFVGVDALVDLQFALVRHETQRDARDVPRIVDTCRGQQPS